MQHFTPIQYLMIDIANSFGLDKETWETRLQWFADNEEIIATNPKVLASQAEEPAQFLAGAIAYYDVCTGVPTGYLCGLDATASGLQLLSILAGCEQSASTCNVINTGKREDAYNRMHAEIQAYLKNPKTAPIRKAVKAALMTHLYGSKLEPIKAFGEDTDELKAFYAVIDTLLPGADQLNRDLISLWRPDVLAHEWTLPDGFDVVVKVMATMTHKVQFLGEEYEVREQVNASKEKGLSMGANIIHSIDGMIVREMNRRCNYDVKQINEQLRHLGEERGSTYTLRKKDLSLLRQIELFNSTGFMSAVILEYLDEYNSGHLSNSQRLAVINLIESMPDCPFSVLAVHDCFKFHPNYGNDVRQQYINILAEIAESDMLSSIATQVSDRPVNARKLSNNLPALIRQSEYALS